MLGGNQDDGMMSIQMVFTAAAEPISTSQGPAGFPLSHGAAVVPTGAACHLPSHCLQRPQPGSSLFGHVGRDRSDFPLMVSVSLVQF